MSLIQVSFGLVGDQVDEVEALLLEIEKPNWNIYRDQDTQSAHVNGIFETELEALLEWERMFPAFREVLGNVEPRFGLLADEDWKYAYQNHFQAWTFQRMHWVPEWERETYEVPDGEAVVWLDPGMAFGSGNHETTRLCIERLMEYLEITRGNHRSVRRLSLCDAGCGSGILAISARILGIENVVGFDNDPNSVRVSQTNAELNSLNNKIEFYEGDLETGFRGKTYHLVIANLLSAVLASILFGGVLAGILLFFLEIRLIVRSPFGKQFQHHHTQKAQTKPVGEKGLVGQRGKVLTTMAPSGKVLINNKSFEAASEGGLIKQNATVEVVRSEHLKLIVKKI